VIELDVDLPQGALLNGCAAELSAAITACGGTWLHGDDASLRLAADGETLIGWRSVDGLREALPIKPNEGHGRRAVTESGQGLRCVSGENCGFHLPELTEQVETFSMAVFFHADPQAEPRTLLTLNGEGRGRGSSYLFLSDSGDGLVVKDTGQCLSLEVPGSSGAAGLRVLVVTVSGDRVALQEGFGDIHTARGTRPDLPTPASLFIGARSHRGGLQKTLGASVIEDVMFWPGVSLLMPRSPRDEGHQTRLERFALWR
jgi:hypothetical protein